MISSQNEEAVREEVGIRIGRELPDAAWREAYTRAKQKLRYIIANFGDDDGARNTVDYIAQLTVEAIRAEALAQYTAALYELGKKEGADANADPRGHTNMITQTARESQAVFA